VLERLVIANIFNGDISVIVKTEYRKIGYTIADAFRIDPKYGRKVFTIDTEKLGTENIEQIAQAAKDTAPDGYELYKCVPL
jgi:hypothetical protein